MVKALVTGGTGFVGSHVVRALNAAGHRARVLHRASSKLDALAGLEYESALGDVLDEDAVRAACHGCDWVFHVAAVADYWQADESHMFAVNIEGTRRVLRAARAAGVRRVIITRSAAAVRHHRDGRPADERTPFNYRRHHWPYGYSKLKAEEVARYAVDRHGQEVIILNPVVILGPGDLNMISGRFITEIARLKQFVPVTSGGTGFVDVRDVARWHLAAAEDGRPGERYLLGAANYPLRDWYAMVADTVDVPRPFLPVPDLALPVIAWAASALRRTGVTLPVDADQVRLGGTRLFFDYRKTWAAFGPPAVDMHTSLRDTYAWYQVHGYLPG